MTMPATRPSFAALLRAGLPAGPLDFAPFVIVALVLRYFARVSWAASAITAAALVPLAVVTFAGGAYVMARFPRRSAGGDEGDGDGR